MKAPLQNIQVPSVYKHDGILVDLPAAMSQVTPDMAHAIEHISEDVESLGGNLIFSDLFRSYDMQFQARLDYTSGKKKAYSPAAGGSMHEAGRAMDIDILSLKMTLKNFWNICSKYGVTPIIKTPSTSLSECWHFDCRGSHGIVYNYYAAGKAKNMKPYYAMAASAILSVGIKVDRFANCQNEAFIQSALIRLGYDIGAMDGEIGPKCWTALEREGWGRIVPIHDIAVALEYKLARVFPNEY
jgi:hypothetical protein